MANYIKGGIEENLVFSTLASGVGAEDTFDQVVNVTTRVSSIDVAWSVDQLGAADSILFGVAHSDYTLAEIVEVIQQANSWTSADKVAKEVADRQVREIGVITNNSGLLSDAVFRNGDRVKTKLNWLLHEGQTLKMWVFNRQAAAVSTGTLKADGHANLWQRGA